MNVIGFIVCIGFGVFGFLIGMAYGFDKSKEE
jgi:hypothetical protein